MSRASGRLDVRRSPGPVTGSLLQCRGRRVAGAGDEVARAGCRAIQEPNHSIMSASRDSLPPGTLLGPYRIKSLVAQGGFSLVYLAIDEDTGDEVIVKEYMPKTSARRDTHGRVVPSEMKYAQNLHIGRKLFFQEAKAVASLRHPSIVSVLAFFLANDTGYLVMPNERGRNLGAFVQERRVGVSTTFILEVFVPVLEALALLHRRGMVHLDVKPGNIHLRHGNRPMLLDLGAVHLLQQGRPRGGQVITAGYSPIEQYLRDGRIGPWSDVYAVGATMRACMEGRVPPPAPERKTHDTLIPATEKLKTRYPSGLLELVDWAMSVEPEMRPRDAGELLQAVHQRVVEPLEAGPGGARG